jgi:hypothetical protein
MSATFILTTTDAGLASDWARQLPVPPLALAGADALSRELLRPGARVWIRDIRDPSAVSRAHADTVMILVGEPQSQPFEDARNGGSNTYCLSYEESRSQLRRLAPAAAELAQCRAVLAILQERPKRTDPAAADASDSARPRGDDLEFLSAAIEHLDDRKRIIEEFRRGVRVRIRSSKAVVFLRDAKRFVAEDEKWECPADHDLVRWLQEHAAIVDSATLDSVEDAAVESAIRQKLGEWNSRLLIPLEVHGVLEGWVAFGPRADGRPYSNADRDESLTLVRLFSSLVGQHQALRRALAVEAEVGLLRASGPRFCVLAAGAKAGDALPVEAREVVSLALREGARVEREFGRLRVAAGPVPGTGGCWVWWDHSDMTAEALAERREAERHKALHDIGTMISHELANAMFSVSTYFQHLRRQVSADEPVHPLADRAAKDLERMKTMPHLLSTLYEMTKQPTKPVDMKRLVLSVAKELGGQATVPESGPVIWGHEGSLRDALLWLCRAIVEAKDAVEPIVRDARIAITLQQRGRDEAAVCLVSIGYPGLRLGQVRVDEATTTEEYPTVPVFLAREVIRFHYGSVHVGQGIDGPELMVSLRSRRVNAIAELAPQAGKSADEAPATPFGQVDGAGPAGSEQLPASA